ncbi:MAG: hypothetical protein K9G62_02320 [Alphaproteobacteria bacterium]|nr:hypothetical protein [Alphaproteobacteria bacterium]
MAFELLTKLFCPLSKPQPAIEPGDEVIDLTAKRGGFYYKDYDFGGNFPQGGRIAYHGEEELPGYCVNKNKLILIRKSPPAANFEQAMSYVENFRF